MTYKWRKHKTRPPRNVRLALQADALKSALLSIRGCYEPPKFVLDRLTTGDRIQYEIAKKHHEADRG